ncbi:MAG: hypothetical protein GY792_17775, partial [Gammaproteobacteria bacterium]|nr:hypothetical protein [Gammaproteobacteria bacterium]
MSRQDPVITATLAQPIEQANALLETFKGRQGQAVDKALSERVKLFQRTFTTKTFLDKVRFPVESLSHADTVEHVLLSKLEKRVLWQDIRLVTGKNDTIDLALARRIGHALPASDATIQIKETKDADIVTPIRPRIDPLIGKTLGQDIAGSGSGTLLMKRGTLLAPAPAAKVSRCAGLNEVRVHTWP